MIFTQTCINFLLSSVHIWKKNRKRFQPMFGNNRMVTYTEHFNNKIYHLVDVLKKLVDEAEFDAWNYLPHTAFDIISSRCIISFSKQVHLLVHILYDVPNSRLNIRTGRYFLLIRWATVFECRYVCLPTCTFEGPKVVYNSK